MTCINPYVVSIGRAFPCGRCYYCRRAKAKVWTHRIILEAAQHSDNAFITLTYDDEHLPGDGSLDPRALQLFLKRLRFAISPAKIRYFAVGEYGDRTARPHYHLALFGYPSCTGAPVHRGEACVCTPCRGIAAAWTDSNGISLGFISNGTLEPASAGYVAAYATKSMEKGDADIKYGPGKIPPFSRQSLKPGIGAGVCDDIASALLSFGYDNMESLPVYLSHGRDKRPLGRYLRNRIRERSGITKQRAIEYAYTELDKKMQHLRQIALAAPPGKRSWQFREEVVNEKNNQRLRQDTRSAIFKQRRKL